jgi:hypothetical protein
MAGSAETLVFSPVPFCLLLLQIQYVSTEYNTEYLCTPYNIPVPL